MDAHPDSTPHPGDADLAPCRATGGEPGAAAAGSPARGNKPEPAALARPAEAAREADDFEPLSYLDLEAAARDRGDWLWRGLLAPGNLTLLTSLWKSGKSTLIGLLLARMKTGGLLGGLEVRPGRAVVVSEEAPLIWYQRGQAVDLSGHVQWFCQPFRGRATPRQWQRLMDRIRRLHDAGGVDLLVIDSLSKLAPLRTENDAVQMQEALAPLEAVAAHGPAALVAHHPRKGAVRPGQAARGSGALTASVDIAIEMFPMSGRPGDRRRRLRCYSRYEATPRKWVMELTADGKDYRSLGASGEPDLESAWPALEAVLGVAERPLSRAQLLARWPETAARPSRATLARWLERLVQEGKLTLYGEGRRKDPYKYALANAVERWQRELWERLGLERDQPGEKPAR
jgi:hypothetical protein